MFSCKISFNLESSEKNLFQQKFCKTKEMIRIFFSERYQTCKKPEKIVKGSTRRLLTDRQDQKTGQVVLIDTVYQNCSFRYPLLGAPGQGFDLDNPFFYRALVSFPFLPGKVDPEWFSMLFSIFPSPILPSICSHWTPGLEVATTWSIATNSKLI